MEQWWNFFTKLGDVNNDGYLHSCRGDNVKKNQTYKTVMILYMLMIKKVVGRAIMIHEINL